MRALLSCFLLAVIGCFATAQDKPAPKEPAAQAREYFAKFDSDANGKVIYTEITAVIRKETGQDGIEKLIDDKYTPMLARLLQQFLAADVNDDGEMTEDELTDLLRKQAESSGFRPGLSNPDVDELHSEIVTPMVKLYLKLGDKNGDDELSLEEEGKLMQRKSDELATDFFKLYDKSGNGTLDSEEIAGFLIELLTYGHELTGADYDYSACFKVKGLAWVHSYKDFSPDGLSPTIKHEVLEVGDKQCKVRSTALDRELEPVKGVEPVERWIPFSEVEVPAAKGKETLTIEGDTIQVEAGKFECRRVTVDALLERKVFWYSKEYPGLAVKVEKTSFGKVVATIELMQLTKPKD